MITNGDGWPPNRPSMDINLCAGAGGLALGLVRSGFSPLEFYDGDRGACETLKHNLRKDHFSLHGRVIEGDLSQIEWISSGSDVRLLAAGAPCQPFSMGGSRKGHGDKRNLFPTLLKAVRVLRPRAVLIENVRGLERGAHKPYLDYLLRQLRYPELPTNLSEAWEDHDQRLRQHDTDRKARATYRVEWAVFNAADFGVSQIRHRLFIVATAMDLREYRFPAPTHSKRRLLHEQASGDYWDRRGLPAPRMSRQPPLNNDEAALLPWVTVRDRTSGLPPPSFEENDECNNHWKIPGARAYPGHTGSTLDWPSKTLKAGVHGVPGGENMMVCDNGSLRYYTLREMARIQTFPDDHYFTGARSNVTRQIGNAVPCDLAAAVAVPLRKLFDLESSGQVEAKYDDLASGYQKVRPHTEPPNPNHAWRNHPGSVSTHD